MMAGNPAITVEALVRRVDGISVSGASWPETRIRDVRIDSREVSEGALFVALPGAQTDGHRYIEDAVANGASAVVVERGRCDSETIRVPCLEAESTRRVLGGLAAEFFGHPSRDLTVVGITGTNGKTTTAHLAADVLSDRWKVGRIGTVGARWGDHRESLPNTTPESLELQRLMWRMSADGVEVVVLEVSSHGLVTHRMRRTAVDVGVFTNLSQDHLDFHGNMASYREAKASLFEEHLVGDCTPDGQPVALFNGSDETGRQFARRFAQRAYRVGTFRMPEEATERGGVATGAEVDYRAVDVTLTLEGAEFRVEWDGDGVELETEMLGAFNVSNATAAFAVARELGMAVDSIRRALRSARAVRGRMEAVTPNADAASDVPSVFVDYAHTPEALERALSTLRSLTQDRLLVVFGCGGDRDRGKRGAMGRTAVTGADVVFVTSDNPRSEAPDAIISDIVEGMTSVDVTESRRVRVVPERGEAISAAIAEAAATDTVLIAGKGHETYQEIGGRRRAFDDSAQARRALSSWQGSGRQEKE